MTRPEGGCLMVDTLAFTSLFLSVALLLIWTALWGPMTMVVCWLVVGVHAGLLVGKLLGERR